MREKSAAFVKGKKAFKYLVSIKENPYEYPSKKFFDWFSGYYSEANRRVNVTQR